MIKHLAILAALHAGGYELVGEHIQPGGDQMPPHVEIYEAREAHEVAEPREHQNRRTRH